jgi:hypothetical protein
MTTIRVKCIKDGSKLRIRIISNGYNTNANCQFPRDIRRDGAEYEVPVENVSFSENAQKKFFYRIKKNGIIILDQSDIKATNEAIKHIFENEETECIICYTNAKSVVFAPCGHYCCCDECATQMKGTCPLCRQKIGRIVNHSEICLG